jgi:hypothetical protein
LAVQVSPTAHLNGDICHKCKAFNVTIGRHLASPMAQKLKTIFAVEGSGRSLVMVPGDFTVGQFIQLANTRLHRTDLRFAWLNENQLLEDEELQPFWSESAVFNLTRGGAAPSASAAPNVPRPPSSPASPPARPAVSAAPVQPTSKYQPVRHRLPDASAVGSGSFRVFTSLSLDSMTVGRDIALRLNLGVGATVSAILSSLGGPIPANASVLLYLGCGVPFVGGTLKDFVSAFPKVARVIYAVVSEHVDDDVLSAEYTELCNVSDAARQRLLSPMIPSTESGFTQIAALLGYVSHGGVNRDHFIAALAQLTGFAPLVVGLHRIAKSEWIFGRDILSVTSPLYGFVQAFVVCTPDKVFDYLLRVGSFAIADVETDDVLLPIRIVTVDSSSREAGQRYYAARGLSSVRTWQPTQEFRGHDTAWNVQSLEASSRTRLKRASRHCGPWHRQTFVKLRVRRSTGQGKAGCHCSWLRRAMGAVGSRVSTLWIR